MIPGITDRAWSSSGCTTGFPFTRRTLCLAKQRASSPACLTAKAHTRSTPETSLDPASQKRIHSGSSSGPYCLPPAVFSFGSSNDAEANGSGFIGNRGELVSRDERKAAKISPKRRRGTDQFRGRPKRDGFVAWGERGRERERDTHTHKHTHARQQQQQQRKVGNCRRMESAIRWPRAESRMTRFCFSFGLPSPAFDEIDQSPCTPTSPIHLKFRPTAEHVQQKSIESCIDIVWTAVVILYECVKNDGLNVWRHEV